MGLCDGKPSGTQGGFRLEVPTLRLREIYPHAQGPEMFGLWVEECKMIDPLTDGEKQQVKSRIVWNLKGIEEVLDHTLQSKVKPALLKVRETINSEVRLMLKPIMKGLDDHEKRLKKLEDKNGEGS